MKKYDFGQLSDGTMASAYEIENSKGMRAVLTDFGAANVSLFVKDKNGKLRDVVLGYDEASSYEKQGCYFGATVGRYANRIANARITIDGVEYVLEANDNENNLHSGTNGTSKKLWQVKEHKGDSITFQYLSKDLEQGFPGNATIEVTYSITENNDFIIDYHAVSDKKTTFNMTNHNYYNLKGFDGGSVYDTELKIYASGYTPVKDGKAIPTGEIAPVAGTPFDFTVAKTIGQDIEADNEQLKFVGGYDHNFALDKTTDQVELAATAYSAESGIQMDILTDCVGIQLYTANFIGGQIGKRGVKHNSREAFCIETQFFPNSINDKNFVRPITEANVPFETKTVHHFTVR